MKKDSEEADRIVGLVTILEDSVKNLAEEAKKRLDYLFISKNYFYEIYILAAILEVFFV